MSDTLNVGPITLTTTGEQTGRFLGTGTSTVPGTFAALVRQTNNLVTYSGSTPSQGSPAYTLVVPAGFSGSGNYLTGQQIAIAAGSAPTVTYSFGNGFASAASATTVQGFSNDPANLIDVWGGNARVTELGQNSTVAAGGANNTVLLGGNNQSLFVDSGSSGTYTETGNPYGSASSFVKGSANIIVVGSFGAAQPTSSSGQTNLSINNSNFVDLIDPTASEVVTAQTGANTIIATAGTATVFSAAGGDLYNGSGGNASLYFVGDANKAPASTVTGGSGSATLFAESGVVYTEGSGTNIYVGGTGTSTVTGGSGHDLLFGGTAGDLYNVGGGSEFYVNGGGVDTISGGTVGPSVYGSNNGIDIMVGTQAGVFAADGSNDVLNAAQAKQGNTFFALNVPGVGNSTLVGSAAPGGGDRFAVESVTGAANLPHQITIQNFHSGDAFFLEGYSTADTQAFTQAVNTATPGVGFSVTLSDNTTIAFTGQHPSAVFDQGTIAI